jgi:hypothetical protein
MNATYVLPVRLPDGQPIEELAAYIRSFSGAEMVVVDGSGPEIFGALQASLAGCAIHVPPDPSIKGRNGKARGLLTGLQIARHDKIVVADDDVRYDGLTLAKLIGCLDRWDVVRPQNYFHPTPWHAVIDSARSLINRALDGDWPGTLAFRKSALPKGYNADVLFENLELVRTIRRRGGRELVARDIFVARRPPTARHFWHQRVRQAYDEFARPTRLVVALSLLPTLAVAMTRRNFGVVAMLVLVPVFIAGAGRARNSAHRYFSWLSVAAAPLWVLERACSSWLALFARVLLGGMRYGDTVITAAATPNKDTKKWCA